MFLLHELCEIIKQDTSK